MNAQPTAGEEHPFVTELCASIERTGFPPVRDYQVGEWSALLAYFDSRRAAEPSERERWLTKIREHDAALTKIHEERLDDLVRQAGYDPRNDEPEWAIGHLISERDKLRKAWDSASVQRDTLRAELDALRAAEPSEETERRIEAYVKQRDAFMAEANALRAEAAALRGIYAERDTLRAALAKCKAQLVELHDLVCRPKQSDDHDFFGCAHEGTCEWKTAVDELRAELASRATLKARVPLPPHLVGLDSARRAHEEASATGVTFWSKCVCGREVERTRGSTIPNCAHCGARNITHFTKPSPAPPQPSGNSGELPAGAMGEEPQTIRGFRLLLKAVEAFEWWAIHDFGCVRFVRDHGHELLSILDSRRAAEPSEPASDSGTPAADLDEELQQADDAAERAGFSRGRITPAHVIDTLATERDTLRAELDALRAAGPSEETERRIEVYAKQRDAFMAEANSLRAETAALRGIYAERDTLRAELAEAKSDSGRTE